MATRSDRLGLGQGDEPRREIDARHVVARRGETAGDPAEATGDIEDAGPGRQPQTSHDLRRVLIRVPIVGELGVEVQVVVPEGGIDVEFHGLLSPTGANVTPRIAR